MDTPKNISEKVVDPNKDKNPLEVAKPSEVSTRNKSKSTKKLPYLKYNRKYEWLHGNNKTIKTQ